MYWTSEADLSGFILGNVADWLFGEQIGVMLVCDIRCDICLKIRLFYRLITNEVRSFNENWSKKKQ